MYEIKWVCEHIEVFLHCKFQFSADNMRQVWQRWHLNDMRAGTPKQEEAIRRWRSTTDDPSYDAACKMLESIDLLFDNGYRYGTAWLKEEVPVDVLEWLFKLPGTGNTFMEAYTPEVNQSDFDAIIKRVLCGGG